MAELFYIEEREGVYEGCGWYYRMIDWSPGSPPIGPFETVQEAEEDAQAAEDETLAARIHAELVATENGG